MTEMINTTDTKAPFNMAIATLQRLSDLLREITKNDQNILFNTAQRQAQKVLLVKQFFIQSIPLLTEKQRKQYQEEVLSIKAFEKAIIVKDGSQTKDAGNRVFFDENLEKKLNEILINIQICLQDEKFFMPPKRDLGRAIGEF